MVSVTCDVGYTYVPILVFLGLSVLDLGPMYATDRHQTDEQTSSDKSIIIKRTEFYHCMLFTMIDRVGESCDNYRKVADRLDEINSVF